MLQLDLFRKEEENGKDSLCTVFYQNQPAQRIWKVMAQQNGKGKKPVLDSNAKVSDGSAALSLPPQPTSPNPNSNP